MAFATAEHLLFLSWSSFGFCDTLLLCSPNLIYDSFLSSLLALLPPPMTKLWVHMKAMISAFCSFSSTRIPPSHLQWTFLCGDPNHQSQRHSSNLQYVNSNSLWNIFTWITCQLHFKFTFILICSKFTYSFLSSFLPLGYTLYPYQMPPPQTNLRNNFGQLQCTLLSIALQCLLH